MNTKLGDRVTVGPFTWEREDNGGCECWNLVRDPDLKSTFWALKNYGGKPRKNEGFSGWRLVSGGPFTNAGGWTSRKSAMKGVLLWLAKRYFDDAQEAKEKAERTLLAVARLQKQLQLTAK